MDDTESPGQVIAMRTYHLMLQKQPRDESTLIELSGREHLGGVVQGERNSPLSWQAGRQAADSVSTDGAREMCRHILYVEKW